MPVLPPVIANAEPRTETFPEIAAELLPVTSTVPGPVTASAFFCAVLVANDTSPAFSVIVPAPARSTLPALD